MLKWLGLLALAAAAAGTGLFFSDRLRMRTVQLEAARLWILDMEAAIRYTTAPIPALLEKMAGEQAYRSLWFLPALAKACRPASGQSAGTALEAIFRQRRFLTDRLAEGDRDILLSYAGQLGCSDRDGQIRLCSLSAGRLERQLEEARRAYAEKGRLYSLLGVFAGAALVLFFI